MTSIRKHLAAGLLLLACAAAPLHAANRETVALDEALAVVQTLPTDPHKCIPPVVMREVQAVVVIPHLVRVGLVLDHKSGHGVMLVRRPDGSWSEPIFVDLEGNGIGVEAGVQTSDLVLLLKSQHAVQRILKGKGKLTLGTDATIAAGPVGAEAENAAKLWRKAEVFAYSRNKGLFVGLSLEGNHLRVDDAGNEAYYSIRGCRPEQIMSRAGTPVAEPVFRMWEGLNRLAAPRPVVVVPR